MSSPCQAADPINEARLAAETLFGLRQPRLTRLSGGRINHSYLAQCAAGRFVIQRLSDFFGGDPSLGRNWQAVRAAAEGRGQGRGHCPVPEIFPSLGGDFLPQFPGGGYYRLTAHLDGGPPRPGAAEAGGAARLLGRLHSLLNSPWPVELVPPPEVEATNQRLTRPEDFETLAETYQGHPHLESLKPLMDQGADAARQLPAFPGFLAVFSLAEVVIHGDPKADNFLFTADGRPLALVDWDTVRYGHALVDVAEMLRSWGVVKKGADHSQLDLTTLAAVVEGYAQTAPPLSPADLTLLPPVLRAVTVTLARRYLTDSLAEVYFHWDAENHPSLHHQNRARAGALLNLAESILDREMSLADLFTEAYARGRQKAA